MRRTSSRRHARCEQINNQITSLQNQTQMLLNQARNLANLPQSSLQQLQQSIQSTQQLLGQAQRIAYDVQQIDRAFSTTYGAGFDLRVRSLADRRRTPALAELRRGSPGRAQGAGRRRRQPRHQPHAMSSLVTSSQSATGALAGDAGRQPDPRLADPAARRSHRRCRRAGPRTEHRGGPAHRRAGAGPRTAPPLPDAGPGLSARQRPDVPAMKARLRFRRESAQPHGDAAGCLRAVTLAFVAAMIALAVHQSRRDSRRAGGWSASECRRRSAGDRTRPLPHHHAGAERIRRHLPPRWAESRRRFSRASPRPSAAANDPATAVPGKDQDRLPSAGVQPEAARHADGRHRRHRSFPRGLHPLHRFRLWPARRGSRFHRHHADRNRHDDGGAVLVVGRR